jgi:cbb3-type cytochrome oxidase cytochrome c subunit
VKVTFIDQIEDIPFTDVVEIENLKQYNVMYGIREGKEIYVRETCCTKACYIY